MKINYKISDNNNNNRLFKYNFKSEQKIIEINLEKEIKNSIQTDVMNKNIFQNKTNDNFLNKKKITYFPPKKINQSINPITSISSPSFNKNSIYDQISHSNKSLGNIKNKDNLLELEKNEIKSLNNNNERSKEKPIENKNIKNVQMYLDKYKIKDLNDEEINNLEYEEAIIIDKRTYFQYYYSLLKKKI